MLHDQLSILNEQRMLVENRRSDSMSCSMRWIKRVGMLGMIVVLLTFLTSAVVLIAEFQSDSDAVGISNFLDLMVILINYLLIIVYVFGFITVFYFLRYMYLDYLLKKNQPARI